MIVILILLVRGITTSDKIIIMGGGGGYYSNGTAIDYIQIFDPYTNTMTINESKIDRLIQSGSQYAILFHPFMNRIFLFDDTFDYQCSDEITSISNMSQTITYPPHPTITPTSVTLNPTPSPISTILIDYENFNVLNRTGTFAGGVVWPVTENGCDGNCIQVYDDQQAVDNYVEMNFEFP